MVDITAGYLGHPYNIYYEHLQPGVDTAKPPILFIHGGSQTGACYRTTPDGRQGWADYFAVLGFPCFVADWPGYGRSASTPLERVDYAFLAEAFEALVRYLGGGLVVLTHSMSGPIGWKLLETIGPDIELVVGIAPGPPGNIQAVLGTATLEDKSTGVVEERDDFVHIRYRGIEFVVDPTRPYADLDDYMVKGAIGTSSRFPPGDWRPTVAPCAPRVLIERLNVHGSALHLSPDTDLAGGRALVVTGTADSNHHRDDDKAIVDFLQDRGADARFLWLGDIGIYGNGHMLMYEDNSQQIADILAEEIATLV